MILRNKNEKKNFCKKKIIFWPNFWQASVFLRDETRDAQVSTGYTCYQIVRWAKGYNSSYIKRLRADAMTSSGQFTEKKLPNYAS